MRRTKGCHEGNVAALFTKDGRAEILLTPGVFLRLGDNSSVKMISSSLTETQAALTRGQALSRTVIPPMPGGAFGMHRG